MNTALIDWLLTGPVWMQYRVQLDLLHKKEGDTKLKNLLYSHAGRSYTFRHTYATSILARHSIETA